MIGNMNIFDCTLREVGYQTGWYFEPGFARELYMFAQTNGVDYVEIGFTGDAESDSGHGDFRYCSLQNEKIRKIFMKVKNRTKIAAMRDIQKILPPLLPKNESVIDTIRIMTRSGETKFDVLEQYVDEALDFGYEVFINYTNAGYNSMEMNKQFAEFAALKGVRAIEFADTQSVMTETYVKDTIRICHEQGVKCGCHFHDKRGMAETLAETAMEAGADYMDVTHMGLGGKWRDGNLTMEYLLRRFGVNPGYEATRIKIELIQQLIKYNEFSAAI
jgi:4-hydroxy 2-oxovalerate aldolase